jgi:hypothetical protein
MGCSTKEFFETAQPITLSESGTGFQARHDRAQKGKIDKLAMTQLPVVPISRRLYAAIHSRSKKGAESEKRTVGVSSREQKECFELEQMVRIVGQWLVNTRSQESVRKLAKAAALGAVRRALSLTYPESGRHRKQHRQLTDFRTNFRSAPGLPVSEPSEQAVLSRTPSAGPVSKFKVEPQSHYALRYLLPGDVPYAAHTRGSGYIVRKGPAISRMR